MKYLELLVSGDSQRYMMHVQDDEKISNVINCAVTIDRDYCWISALYHFRSGRFLNEEKSVSENGVESGDTVLLVVEEMGNAH